MCIRDRQSTWEALYNKQQRDQKQKKSKFPRFITNILHRLDLQLKRGRLYFLMFHHSFLSMFVDDSIFTSRRCRLFIYITTFLSQLFTSTVFFESPYKNAPEASLEPCDTSGCVFSQAIKNMTGETFGMMVVNNLLTLPLLWAAALLFIKDYSIASQTNVARFIHNTKMMRLRALFGYLAMSAYCLFCIVWTLTYSYTHNKDLDIAAWILTFIFTLIMDIIVKEPLFASIKLVIVRITSKYL
eukprot:TRINITY_DN6102_c0_g3_i6.p1 TRINITY_DN6102_c0_g3~~TRINITY_DN6102_c0_g3_i6.p1  ORF type:complete len:242 (-),score=54.85 TRINITY_DN6102_c0_g3_i6:151-876(-)